MQDAGFHHANMVTEIINHLNQRLEVLSYDTQDHQISEAIFQATNAATTITNPNPNAHYEMYLKLTA